MVKQNERQARIRVTVRQMQDWVFKTQFPFGCYLWGIHLKRDERIKIKGMPKRHQANINIQKSRNGILMSKWNLKSKELKRIKRGN